MKKSLVKTIGHMVGRSTYLDIFKKFKGHEIDTSQDYILGSS
jgi:hypothetical protein